MVGEDGFHFLDAFETAQAPQEARELPILTTLRRTWQRHYNRIGDKTAGAEGGAVHRVRFKTNRALPPAAEGIESPYDPEARYRHKREDPMDRLHGARQRNVRAHCPAPPHARPHDAGLRP